MIDERDWMGMRGFNEWGLLMDKGLELNETGNGGFMKNENDFIELKGMRRRGRVEVLSCYVSTAEP